MFKQQSIVITLLITAICSPIAYAMNSNVEIKRSADSIAASADAKRAANSLPAESLVGPRELTHAQMGLAFSPEFNEGLREGWVLLNSLGFLKGPDGIIKSYL